MKVLSFLSKYLPVIGAISTLFLISMVLNSAVLLLRKAGYEEDFVAKNLWVLTGFAMLYIPTFFEGCGRLFFGKLDDRRT